MKTKSLLAFFLLSSLLISCSKNGGTPSDGIKTSSGAIISEQSEVVSALNQAQGSQGAYQLSAQEIEELFSSGTITEQQKQELLALVQP
ncbi:MAG: hypothetical protein COW00_17220 [Bdellovibrio sp. CG12_big_fil_rev_8_21_14_0_65_39_13]|nr:MAG: hypothetical protein COW78_00390 [Bdellovibrio sp. CG22_combo_CG10-13_8_21_14_all_39_27]PIQ58176.1 MAG: hypothetical protein COW00_17220 [Bdellovibrio sp. CG12_big_fil_rev_8_21_14_0_65_39_13]PIR34338.1 MAG: hypothetical protein COV37_13460 [Bdellovibrio sp. CG11_big_fil_rev_8_21_14_0_20_39_38]